MTPTMMKATTQSSFPDRVDVLKDIDKVANELDMFFTTARALDGGPLSEGIVIGAVGALFAHKAKNEEDCRRLIQAVYTAIHASYTMKAPT